MRQAIVALILVASIDAAPAAQEKGWFGFKLAVKTSGFALNPTVVMAVVQSVEPNSPASEQNIAAGDEIVDVEGKTVAGNKARELKPFLTKGPGEVLHLHLKRKDGKIYSATVTATKRPG